MSTHRARPSAVTLRCVLLGLVLLCSLGLVPGLDAPARTEATPHLPFLLLAGLFAAGGLLVFHLEFRNEAHSFLLSEVPLVLGLFLVDPWVLIGARVLGEMVALLFHARQPPLKMFVNLSVWTAECVFALMVVDLFGHPSAISPEGWAVAFAAIGVADLVGNSVIYLVIRWHGARPAAGPLVLTAAGTAVCNCALGVLALLLVHVHLASLVVLGILGAALFLAYRGYTDLHQRYASLALLHDFGQATAGALRPDDVAEAMLHHARRLMRTEIAELVLLPAHGPGARLTLSGSDPLLHATVEDLDDVRPVLADAEPCLARRDSSPGELIAFLDRHGAKDALLVRLNLGAGALAVFAVAGRLADISTLDAQDARLFVTLAHHAAAALEKGRLIDRLRDEAQRREHQAMHDTLTGLPNRSSFHESTDAAIARARVEGGRVAVVLLDLDRFKQVNDTLGHETGDELLQEVGRRLTGAAREGDLAARLGGDEFALLLAPTSDDDEAVMVAAARIADLVQRPSVLRGIRLDVRASLGVAIWPEHGGDANALLQRADVAMYAAKVDQDGPALYHPESDDNTPRRLQLAADLRTAVEDGSLCVHYQPKADLRTGRITGAEALSRWTHPEHGPVSPDEFIPVAEQTGLVTLLTMFVLSDALAQCARWEKAGLGIGVAVNVSARSLLDTGFVDDVLGLVVASAVPAALVTLEVTETSIMGDTRRALDQLHRLADFGVRLSVDDFGTGYSSLAYLQQLPVQELKVDKSFVLRMGEDEASRAIVRSVIELGHGLGLLVVAEGVENQHAWDELVDLGCDTAQGYLLSRPMPADALTRWLHGARRRRGSPAALVADGGR